MTAYFFVIANGRRRISFIDSLIIDGVRTSDQSLIMNHIVGFFSSLLAAKPDSGLSFAADFWDNDNKISDAENMGLMIPISDEEIYTVVSSANMPDASGPDGFSFPFFTKFWPELRGLIYKIIQGFCLRTVDISRLNYVVITIIPKVKGADLIS